MPSRPLSGFSRFTRGWLVPILVAVVIATSFKSAIADWNDIPSGSMLPTIWVGDRIFVNKLAYGLKIPYTTYHLWRWSAPKRGEIAVFFSPEDGQRLVKRVIGVPGDVISLKKNRLFINQKPIIYRPLGYFKDDHQAQNDSLPTFVQFEEQLPGKIHPMMVAPGIPALNSFGPIRIPSDHYFMMGDNRDNSNDSRFFGMVARDQIIGRATTVVLSRKGNLFNPRWQRMFKPLI